MLEIEFGGDFKIQNDLIQIKKKIASRNKREWIFHNLKLYR